MLLNYAELDPSHHTPYSTQYGDIYYNPTQGRDESEYVFLAGNHLPQRFSTLSDYQQFTVGETGFGTGLNFLITAEHFLRAAPQHAQLNYISVEKHPIALSALKRIHQDWILPTLRAKLYDLYPHNHSGYHLLKLHPRIHLLLLLGDANDLLPQLHAKVDAWYLDGFAPSKNENLWSQTVIDAIANNSHLQTTLATFSAARTVKERLQIAGFIIKKRNGFGRKRDMITAYYQGSQRLPHWSDPPPPIKPKQTVNIIGAGLAGATTARALAESGTSVRLYHAPISHPAASQVPLAIPYLQLGITDTTMRRYHLSCWHHSIREINQLAIQYPTILEKAPIHLLAETEKQQYKHRHLYQQQLLNDHEWHIDDNATLTLKRLGILHTPSLLSALIHHKNILCYEQSISHLNPTAPTIIATATQIELLPIDWHDQLNPLRGQALILKKDHNIPNATCGAHSILRVADGRIYIGSTYQPNNSNQEIRANERAELLRLTPEATAHYHSDFAGIRATTRDYFPLIGALPDSEHLKIHYARWSKNAKHPIHLAPKYLKPHYLHAGLGSKGTLTAWLGADYLAAILLGKPLPIPIDIHHQLSPARTIIKNIIRR